MLLEIDFTEHSEDDWFISCQAILHEVTGCRVTKQERYFRTLHIAVMFSMTPQEVLTYVSNSNTIHGFVYNNQVFIHPTVITAEYISLVKNRIENRNVIIDNAVQKLQ